MDVGSMTIYEYAGWLTDQPIDILRASLSLDEERSTWVGQGIMKLTKGELVKFLLEERYG